MFVNHLEFLSVVFIDLPLRSFHGGCKIFLPRPRVYLLVCFEWYFFLVQVFFKGWQREKKCGSALCRLIHHAILHDIKVIFIEVKWLDHPDQSIL